MRRKGTTVKKLIKITSVIVVIIMCTSFLTVYSHDLGAMRGMGIDYSIWENEAPVSAPIPTPQPPITSRKYREFEIARATTLYETYTSQANRNNNMKLAAEAIDYTIIETNNVFSFNNIVGPRTEERGYKEATIFVGKEKEQGLGGGICQISSTVYMAAKKAGLKILERYPHSMPVTYCSRDDEATVSWGYLDFRFQNNTGNALRIESSCKGGIVKVIIYQMIPID